MLSGRAYFFLPWVAVVALVFPAGAQSVISTHSGIVHFFEGTVFIGDTQLEAHPGKFPSVPEGAELRTVNGRAEVLLTPGVFIRLGEKSSIRMLQNDLGDTRVALLAGSAIVDSGEPNPDTSVTVIYKNWRVHFLERGVYRIDAEPPMLAVKQGEAEVYDGPSEDPISVEKGMNLPFAKVLVPERADTLASLQSGDALSDWENGRSESIVADNTIAEQIDEDPGARTGDADADAGFTYYPFLDLPYLGMGYSGVYSSYTPSQPGFYSVYLPGYSYRPIMLGLGGRGVGVYTPYHPIRIGATPGYGAGSFPRPVYSHAPLPVAPMHASPGVGMRGGHR